MKRPPDKRGVHPATGSPYLGRPLRDLDEVVSGRLREGEHVPPSVLSLYYGRRQQALEAELVFGAGPGDTPPRPAPESRKVKGELLPPPILSRPR